MDGQEPSGNGGEVLMTMVMFGKGQFKYYSTGHYYKYSAAYGKWVRTTRKQVCSLCLDAGSEQDLSTWVRSMVRVKEA